jgi:hypothetical protein
LRLGFRFLGAHPSCPGIGIHRLPHAQIQIQLEAGRDIVSRDPLTKASFERPLARARDLETKSTEKLRQVLGYRGVAELDCDAPRSKPRLPQTGHLPPIQVWSASEGGQGGTGLALWGKRLTVRQRFAGLLGGSLK